MVRDLWTLITGYIVIKIKGPGIESLLNKIANQGITLWHVERLTGDIIVAKVDVAHFRKLRPLLWQLGLEIRILEKRGLPFLLNRLGKRKFFLLGVLLLGALLYHLSTFIWFIQIQGTENVPKERIMEILLAQDFRVGLPKSRFSPEAMETALVTQINELAWVGVNIKGSLVMVQVVERSMPDLATQQAGNLVAKRDGLITQLLVFRGTPLVGEGATVQAGALLVTGDYYDMRGRKQRGRAEAIVKARVWYEGFGEAAYSKITQTPTGQKKWGYALGLGKFRLQWRDNPGFLMYRRDEHVWQPSIAGYALPITFTKALLEEVIYQQVTVSEQEARILATERAWQMLESQGVTRDQVVATQVKEFDLTDEHGVRVALIVELEENIGLFTPITPTP